MGTDFENSLRPEWLKDFVGQDAVCDNLRIFIQAAKSRSESLDHVLLVGPPGLGKTTLAHIVAREMASLCHTTSGPVLNRAGDLAALLTNLQPNDALFIDEIHRMQPKVEEVLYSAMEDYKIDLLVGQGPAARTVRIDLSPFTLIGATTRIGLVSAPLRERFGIPLRLDPYTQEAISAILKRAANRLGFELGEEAAHVIAKRSRGTPRIACRLLRRVRDFCQNDRGLDKIELALRRLGINREGLDVFDKKYLRTLAFRFGGGPVGVESLAASLGEEADALEDLVEPYLIQLGLLVRTPRGRILSQEGAAYIEENLAGI